MCFCLPALHFSVLVLISWLGGSSCCIFNHFSIPRGNNLFPHSPSTYPETSVYWTLSTWLQCEGHPEQSLSPGAGKRGCSGFISQAWIVCPLPYQPMGRVIATGIPWVEWERWGSGANPERETDAVWAQTANAQDPFPSTFTGSKPAPPPQLLSSLGTRSTFPLSQV